MSPLTNRSLISVSSLRNPSKYRSSEELTHGRLKSQRDMNKIVATHGEEFQKPHVSKEGPIKLTKYLNDVTESKVRQILYQKGISLLNEKSE